MRSATIHCLSIYFYPRPPRGGRRGDHGRKRRGSSNFYPRPPRGGRLDDFQSLVLIRDISTHALREEGDVGESGHCHFRQVISTHALREEGDVELRQPVYKVVEFLPTPSARRATPAPFALVAIFFRFLPTPSARRATEPAAYCLGSKKFLPTPSARRATGAVFVFARYTDISTHALREEGDRVFLRSICPLRNFYPRPPRGGRRGDKLHPGIKLVFLSTPSARRATVSRSPRSLTVWYFYPRPPRGGRPGE